MKNKYISFLQNPWKTGLKWKALKNNSLWNKNKYICVLQNHWKSGLKWKALKKNSLWNKITHYTQDKNMLIWNILIWDQFYPYQRDRWKTNIYLFFPSPLGKKIKYQELHVVISFVELNYIQLLKDISNVQLVSQ